MALITKGLLTTFCAETNFTLYYRYVTVLYYLNDVKYGGETAFPVVDKATFDKQVGSQSPRARVITPFHG